MEPLRSHATIRRADGSVEHVDLDMPPEFLISPSDDLLEMRMSGWQHADEQHPAGGGRPGYRVAYKTVKLMPAKDITIPLPQDSRLKVAMGSLNRGGVHTPDGVPGRQPAHHVVPEYGTLSTDITGAVRYIRCLNPAMSFEAWEEELGGLSYVEIICGVEDAAANDPDALREAGRSKVVALKTMLDLMFGPRLLGIPLLEEIGEVFDDWHWNRRLDSVLLSTELQVRSAFLDPDAFVGAAGSFIAAYEGLSNEDQRRFSLACQWYWLADAEPDQVNRFIQFWLVIESLEMSTTDIAPVKRRLATVLGTSDGVSDFVGRLFGTRGTLVHGDSASVSSDDLDRVEALARILLTARVADVRVAAVPYLRQIQSWLQAN